MNSSIHNLLLADDDTDDCLFFKEALEELPVLSTLKTVYDGEELMKWLHLNYDNLPNALFLDLNMPRKSGFECLEEIKTIPELKNLPIIIFSTSMDMDVVDTLYNNGAHYYLRKPGDFSVLKKVIHEVITTIDINNFIKPSKDKFVLQS
jgi:CheY-like chemotaxis protein